MAYPKTLDHQPRTAIPLQILGRHIRSAGADGNVSYEPLAADAIAPDGAQVVYEIVISTETAVRRPWGMETLSHAPGAIDMSLAERGLSFLLEHGGPLAPNKIDPELHVGVVENVRHDTTQRRTTGYARFGPGTRAALTEAELAAGTRIWISAGWTWLRRPKLLKAGFGPDGQDEFLITKWQLLEASSVSVPADANSHVGLRAGGAGVTVPQEGEEPEEEVAMPKKRVMDDATRTVIEVEDSDPRVAVVESQVQIRAAGDGVDEARKEMAAISKICAQHGLSERAGEWIENGYNLVQVRSMILDLRATTPTSGQPAAERLTPANARPGTINLSEKDAARYNIVRACRGSVEVREGNRNEIDGLEGEVHKEIYNQARASGIQTRGGVFVPMRLRDVSDEYASREDRQMRAVSMGPSVAGGGAELVTHNVGEFIDLLRNRMRCVAMGAQVIPGLVGTMTWPRLTQDPTVQWMGVNPPTAAADSGAQFGFLTSTPKTLIGTVPFPRQLLNMTNLDVQALLWRVLTIGHGLALDLAAIKGKGTDKEPLGIINNPDVQTQAMGNLIPTYVLLRTVIGKVLKKNLTGESMGYMTTPELAAVLSATLMAPSVAGFIWQGKIEDGLVGGYPATATNQMPITGSDHALIAGAWNTLLFLLWGSLELILDPYSLATSGQVRISTFQQGDTVNQRPEGFVVCTGARLTG